MSTVGQKMSVRQQEALMKKQHEEFLESKRKEVQNMELSARFWKAQFETMHFTLESEKIKPSYDEHIDKQRKEAEENRKKMEAMLTAQDSLSSSDALVGKEDPELND